jgi:hypothetical protein
MASLLFLMIDYFSDTAHPACHDYTKSLSLNKSSHLNPPLKKGDRGGFALGRLGKIPPHPPLQRGGTPFADKL